MPAIFAPAVRVRADLRLRQVAGLLLRCFLLNDHFGESAARPFHCTWRLTAGPASKTVAVMGKPAPLMPEPVRQSAISPR